MTYSLAATEEVLLLHLRLLQSVAVSCITYSLYHKASFPFFHGLQEHDDDMQYVIYIAKLVQCQWDCSHSPRLTYLYDS